MLQGAYLTKVFGELFNIFLGALYHAFDNLEALQFETIEPAVGIIERIDESGLMERHNVNVRDRIKDLANRIRAIAAQQYSLKSQELFAAQVGVNRALPLLLLTDWIEKQAKTLDKRFSDPVFGLVFVLRQVHPRQRDLSNFIRSTLDLVSLAVENYVPSLLNDLENTRRRLLEGSMNQPTPDVPIQDIFALYRRTKSMLGLLKAFCPQQVMASCSSDATHSTDLAHSRAHEREDFDLTGYFRPYVQQWLINTDNMTGSWVKSVSCITEAMARKFLTVFKIGNSRRQSEFVAYNDPGC